MVKVSEIFASIQGEGRFQGIPALFIRTSGCTRNCPWCDTKYHIRGKYISNDKLIKLIIDRSAPPTVVFTGGEPLLFKKQIFKIIARSYTKRTSSYHLETNGDLISSLEELEELLEFFNYVCVSPKEFKIANKIWSLREELFESLKEKIDIKIVTDLDKLNNNLIQFATILMPLTTYSSKDLDIERKVWQYCVTHHLLYSARLHVKVWGKQNAV